MKKNLFLVVHQIIGDFSLLSTVFFTLLLSDLCAQPIIPAPLKVSHDRHGKFEFTQSEKIIISHPELENEAEMLQQILQRSTGYGLPCMVSSSRKGRNIYLQIDTGISSQEGYRLTIDPKGIRISGQTAAGIFYGIQTLDQLFPVSGRQTYLQAIEIEDSPRYGYRALMLDPVRYFMPVREVKRFIDVMARYKFNVLHFHLTDDAGWRIEIKKYPLLTAQGGAWTGGFYTQDEIRNLVAYAADRHVEIIPEIDIPGHSVAALHAYPELGCSHMQGDSIIFHQGNQKIQTLTHNRTLCASKEDVYRFCSDVLQEVCALFPSKRIHFGGDEAAIDKNWGLCPDCQALMKSRGMQKTGDLMGYFFNRIHGMVQKHGKEMLLWCELDNIRPPAHGFLCTYPQDCILYSWRLGLTPKVIELAGKAGMRIVLSPGEHCYFDYPQDSGYVPQCGPLITLKRAYDWDPGYGLPVEEQKHIIGVAGLLWGWFMPDMSRTYYMAYPRAIALSEAGWSRMENRSWENFKKNLLPHLSRLMKEGINFRVPFEIYR